MTQQSLTDTLIGRIREEDGELKLTRQDFEETLPEGMDMADVKRHDHQRASYRAAATAALGRRAIEKMEKEEGIDSVNTSAEYGANSRLSNKVRKSHTIGKGEKQKTNYGHSTVVISNGEEPELLDAIATITAQATGLWGNK